MSPSTPPTLSKTRPKMPAPTFHAQSLTELIQLRADTQPDDDAVHTGAAEFGDELKTLSYLDILKSTDRLASYYSELGLTPDTPPSEVPPERVIAVLTSTAVDESLLEIALAKLGLTALLLSVNNSVAAVVHLCKQTQATHLIYGTKFGATAEQAQALLAKEGYELGILAERRFPLWGKGGVRDTKIASFPARLTPAQETRRTCVILHSSGSTGFPKPVYITHYGLIANLAQSIPKTGFSALPLFHGFGHFSIFRCIYNGKAFTLMPPHLPMTAANICRTIKNSPTKPVQHFAVPYVLKLLAETEEGTAALAEFEAVSFAGAAVPDDLGDRLVDAGVPLISVYGTTETGALLNSRRDCKTDKGWNWLRAEGPIADYLELIPQGSGTFEVVIKDGWPAKIVSNREDGAYCTKDLVLQHPDHPTWFKYIGRLDDTLTQTLGEKTNPVPIELAIRGNSPYVAECIVFGDARPQVGALILPSELGAELSKDKAAFIKTIWPVIADANAAAPTHSRILPEMVDVLPYGTEVPVATKMSILRPACYKKFAGIIDAIYERFEQGTGQPKRDIQDQGEMEAFLTETVTTALGDKAAKGLTPDTDLFAFGVDSLQATRVRNVISKSLELNTKLGQNIVYEHPSISQLASYLLALRSGQAGAQDDSAAHRAMWDLVEKWSGRIITPSASTSQGTAVNGHSGEVVILTGATGSLGAHILDQLVSSPQVARVICLSRAKSHEDSLRRVQESLALRERTLTAEASGKITSFAADVNRPDLGLTPEEVETLRTHATAIIHNAWPVNFVLSISSFDEHVGGVVNLLNLALTSPRQVKPAFFFSSSVGTRQGRPDPVVHEDFSDDPVTAGGMGYGRSKWVVEKILERAGGKGARVGVLRIGQLVGDTTSGAWNETEAWPLMFRAATTIKCLPKLDEKPSWLPVDRAAQAISEIVLGTASNPDPHARVYHVLNPHTAQWSAILEGLKKGGLDFEPVDRTVWLERLAASDPDVTKNPTYKLLSFYQNRIGNKTERPHMEFEVVKTSELSPTIASVQAVDSDLVALWTRHWKKTGFLV
ncbi:putative L-aminoadipate-semialdehyde dehydrogenase [Naematelia encephala]|uniref:Putative L-aminoadipate-semialdehyde dehydrogenase n=1 Tax=Naematelia encephala TaxID=71784 RepID=A0A1Y2BHR3_9TREE|nr:putative L-aminoadipate-semialdehyde dehydrogenase [Naematelia encephala]